MRILQRKLFFFALFLLLPFNSSVFAQMIPRLRISLENTESHVQTQALLRFAERLSVGLAGKIDIQVYHSAQLYRDSEVVGALARGDIEMAVPGVWQLGRYVPETEYLLLPDFYGVSSAYLDSFLHQPIGLELISRIENSLNVIVPGHWYDLGPMHIFTTNKQIKNNTDFRSLRIRVAGGVGNKLRVETLGAEGVIIPWPDLPPRIRDGYVDGILTSFESVRSAELWKYGIRFVYIDSEYFGKYVPMVSSSFWRILSPQQQEIFKETWDESATYQKAAAARAQFEARKIAEDNGIIVSAPSRDEVLRTKIILQKNRARIIQALPFDPDFLALERQNNAE